MMTLRSLVALVFAMAVLLAPVLGFAGSSFAQQRADHQQQMVKGEHCQQAPERPSDRHKAADVSCCIAMCAGVALALATAAEPAPLERVPAMAGPQSPRLGFLAEIATPPPKVSREVTS